MQKIIFYDLSLIDGTLPCLNAGSICYRSVACQSDRFYKFIKGRDMMNIEEEILIQKIVARVKPAVPIDVALWDIATVGEYLCLSPGYVRQHIINQKNFPKQIRLPSATDGQAGRPRWRAKHVIDWAESYITTK